MDISLPLVEAVCEQVFKLTLCVGFNEYLPKHITKPVSNIDTPHILGATTNNALTTESPPQNSSLSNQGA